MLSIKQAADFNYVEHLDITDKTTTPPTDMGCGKACQDAIDNAKDDTALKNDAIGNMISNNKDLQTSITNQMSQISTYNTQFLNTKSQNRDSTAESKSKDQMLAIIKEKNKYRLSVLYVLIFFNILIIGTVIMTSFSSK